ncbi:MAG: hypothetical protein APF77_19180 [Clostridia bacterium BRH_c25]|nr:MAG: hypothetical protein APF77_19180 [Clostridia bacterium BRH_c25]
MKKQVCVLLCLIFILAGMPIVNADNAQYYINLHFENVREFNEGLAVVLKNNKWGYIDKEAKEIIKFQYADARDFSEGIAAVNLNGKWGFIARPNLLDS